MIKTACLAGLILLISFNCFTQSSKTDPVCRAEVSKLEFLAGDWKGSGWIRGRDDVKRDFVQTEKVRFKLDNTALLIEGLGISDGEVIHNAMAVVTYNKKDKNYEMQSFLNNGSKGDYKAYLSLGKFSWYPTVSTRYIFWINEKGQWYGTGEFMQYGIWNQFFEMTLDKQ